MLCIPLSGSATGDEHGLIEGMVGMVRSKRVGKDDDEDRMI